jgi:hypothetical protein
MARRKNLVIVRAGDSSLHEEWLQAEGERNWDLIVNYFGDDPQRYRKDDVQRIDSKGPKWPALHDLVQKLGDDAFGYDYVWLPDDDLRTTKDGINSLFDIAAKHRLTLSQPALTRDSHLGHLITLRNRSFHLCFTNFVEIMAPCFSQDFLKQALPSFNENLSGWGLDILVAHQDRGLDPHCDRRRRHGLSHPAARRPELPASCRNRENFRAGSP